MATLHLLSYSPFSDSRFEQCLKWLNSHDALLLTGDAVYALMAEAHPAKQLAHLSSTIQVFALDEDIEARNVAVPTCGIQLIDYPGFVELCGRYAKVNSWL